MFIWRIGESANREDEDRFSPMSAKTTLGPAFGFASDNLFGATSTFRRPTTTIACQGEEADHLRPLLNNKAGVSLAMRKRTWQGHILRRSGCVVAGHAVGA